MSETNEIVYLKYKNIQIQLSTVNVITMSLTSLFETMPIVFYELVMKCRDSNHVFFGNSVEKLKDLCLLQSDGTPHNTIREVVLSSVTGDGLEMCLGSPIAL